MTFADEVEADSPELWWDTRQVVGVAQPDRAGNGHAGTVVGSPTLEAGGLRFDNTSEDQHIEEDADGFAPTTYTTFAVEAVVELDSLNNGFLGGWSDDTDSTYLTLSLQERFTTPPSGPPFVKTFSGAFNDSTNTLRFLENPGTLPTTGVLVHLLLDFDGTDLTLYKNGSVYVTEDESTSGGTLVESAQKWYAGNDPFGLGSFGMDGLLRHSILYTHSLGPARAAAHAAAALADDSAPAPAPAPLALVVNLDTPSEAVARGYAVFGDPGPAFGTAKFAPSNIWAPAPNADVRHFNIQRGSSDRAAALWHADTGSATATLDNAVRDYDPDVNPDIRPNRGLQIQATWDDATYDLFTGAVDNIDPRYPMQGADALTDLNAFDATSLLVDVDVAGRFARQRTGDRLNSLLDLAGIPASRRVISPGATWMPPSQQTASAISALGEVADSEMGEFYVEADGTWTFRDRKLIITEPRSMISQATFGDGPGELPYSEISLSPAYDKERIRNDIRVVYNERGDVARAGNAKSRHKYGRRTFQLQVACESATTAKNLARFLLKLYKEPLRRVDSITVKPFDKPELLLPVVLGARLCDRWTVMQTPPGGGPRIQRDVFVRQIGHDASCLEDWVSVFGFQDASLFGGFIRFGTSVFGGPDTFWF